MKKKKLNIKIDDENDYKEMRTLADAKFARAQKTVDGKCETEFEIY